MNQEILLRKLKAEYDYLKAEYEYQNELFNKGYLKLSIGKKRHIKIELN